MEIRTINDVVKNVPMRFVDFMDWTSHDSGLLHNLYEEMNYPRHARGNTIIVLDYIDYLIKRHAAKDDDFVSFSRCSFTQSAEWANKTVEEINEMDIPEECKKELCNIISNKINVSFNFDW